MDRSRVFEIAALGISAFLIAIGGKLVLVTLGGNKLLGGLIAAALVFVTASALRRAYNPAAPDARVNVTKAAAYFIAATLTLWAVLAPARWVFGSCIFAAEAAIVFDIFTTAVRRRTAGES